MKQHLSRTAFDTLSKREREVVLLIADDMSDRQIARELKIRERTVRAHVSRIILKLGVATRVGAAVTATKWANVDQPQV